MQYDYLSFLSLCKNVSQSQMKLRAFAQSYPFVVREKHIFCRFFCPLFKWSEVSFVFSNIGLTIHVLQQSGHWFKNSPVLLQNIWKTFHMKYRIKRGEASRYFFFLQKYAIDFFGLSWRKNPLHALQSYMCRSFLGTDLVTEFKVIILLPGFCCI